MKPYYDYDVSYIIDMIEWADLPYKVIGMSDLGDENVHGLGRFVLIMSTISKSMPTITLSSLVLSGRNIKKWKNSIRRLNKLWNMPRKMV